MKKKSLCAFVLPTTFILRLEINVTIPNHDSKSLATQTNKLVLCESKTVTIPFVVLSLPTLMSAPHNKPT